MFIGITCPLPSAALGAIEHAVDRARHLDAGIDQRLAALASGLQRERLRSILDQARGLAQDLDPARWRQPGIAVAEQRVGRSIACSACSLSAMSQVAINAPSNGARTSFWRWVIATSSLRHKGDFISFSRAVSFMFSE
jgi:hypothetical protein